MQFLDAPWVSICSEHKVSLSVAKNSQSKHDAGGLYPVPTLWYYCCDKSMKRQHRHHSFILTERSHRAQSATSEEWWWRRSCCNGSPARDSWRRVWCWWEDLLSIPTAAPLISPAHSTIRHSRSRRSKWMLFWKPKLPRSPEAGWACRGGWARWRCWWGDRARYCSGSPRRTRPRSSWQEWEDKLISWMYLDMWVVKSCLISLLSGVFSS